MGGGGGREVGVVIEKQPETSLCQCTIQYLDCSAGCRNLYM